MAVWEAPPQPPSDLERLLANLSVRFDGIETSIQTNGVDKLTRLEIPSLEETAMSSLIADLQGRYPGAF